MTVLQASTRNVRLALVDDDDTDALMVSSPLRRAGVEVVRLQGHLDSVEDLLRRVREEDVSATLCDNRLSTGGLATFSGASAAAAMFDLGLPCVLITTFTDSDAGESIRPWRKKIPSLLRRADARDPDRVFRAIGACDDEIAGKVRPERVGRRTVVRVRGLVTINGHRHVDAIIPAWRQDEAVRLPATLLPVTVQHLTDDQLLGRRFSAEVNTSAEAEEDLFLDRVEEIDLSVIDAGWEE